LIPLLLATLDVWRINIMCGIYGYIGDQVDILPLVSGALRTMEYRGYDSWGIGWAEGDQFSSLKAPGRVPESMNEPATSSLAIGHTRWATHGSVTRDNAHPHFDRTMQIGVVHNGVIENAAELKARYLSHIAFVSETDSEIVPHLVRHLIDAGMPFAEAVLHAFQLLEGSSAIVVANRETNELAAITARSPLRLGRADGAWVLASDPLALAHHAESMAIIPDRTLLLLNGDAHLIDVLSGDPLDIDWREVPADAFVSQGDFDHFTIKEIHDQPEVMERLLEREPDVSPLAEAIRSHQHILLTGCGSAFYAASLGAEWLRRSCDAWIDVIPASEIDPDTRHRGSKTLMIALTQSGETADVVDAIHMARSWEATTAAIVNTESSTVASMVDITVPILAGIERSVLATKSFMAMVVRLLQVAHLVGGADDVRSSIASTIPLINHVLSNTGLIDIVEKIAGQEHVLTLGKGLGRPVAQEAALKIKEGSYVHAEAYLTGELKHGPLALVTHGTPVMLFATNEAELAGARIASREVMSRGGYTVGIGEFGLDECSSVIRIPDIGSATALVHLVVAQRLAYEVALARGVDPDFPRNLAKSVTVR
jgi:glutamine---fructose-6-phosphate transaminase (isomerizing)